MSEPIIPDRPELPPLGAAPREELLVARLRPQARTLFWSAVVLIAACGAAGYAWDNLPARFGNAVVLAGAAGVVLLLVLLPWFVWRGRLYTITTRRVIARQGLFGQRRVELPHSRGYAIETHRGLWQRMWGTGTLTLSDGLEGRIILARVPHPRLVGEVLSDQIEVNQILAHREAEARGAL